MSETIEYPERVQLTPREARYGRILHLGTYDRQKLTGYWVFRHLSRVAVRRRGRRYAVDFGDPRFTGRGGVLSGWHWSSTWGFFDTEAEALAAMQTLPEYRNEQRELDDVRKDRER